MFLRDWHVCMKAGCHGLCEPFKMLLVVNFLV